MTFDWIEDVPSRVPGRPRRRIRGKLVHDRESAAYAVLLARRVLIGDPKHNPDFADALLAAASFLDA